MTPNRSKWWNNLPLEQRRLRLRIKKLKSRLRFGRYRKWELKVFYGGTSDYLEEQLLRTRLELMIAKKKLEVIPDNHPATTSGDIGTCDCGWHSACIDRYCPKCGVRLRWDLLGR